MRFYEIDSSQILLNGVDYRELGRDEVRRCFSMVLPDTWLSGAGQKQLLTIARAFLADPGILIKDEATSSSLPSCASHGAEPARIPTRQCLLLCPFHHQVMVHRMGWALVLNPDGTTTAWNPDRSKVLHSHGPPARAG